MRDCEKGAICEEMRSVRFAAVCALATLVFGAFAACSDGAEPPAIGDPDSAPTKIPPNDDAAAPPCSTPAPGCGCAEAGVQFYCGVIYRKAGELLECSPGYLTCQDDGGWSGCTGPSVYDGN
jgi:hypothetical protein